MKNWFKGFIFGILFGLLQTLFLYLWSKNIILYNVISGFFVEFLRVHNDFICEVVYSFSPCWERFPFIGFLVFPIVYSVIFMLIFPLFVVLKNLIVKKFRENKKKKFSIILLSAGLIISIISIIVYLPKEFDLFIQMALIENIILNISLFLIGWLFDKKWYSSGIIVSSLFIGLAPFFTSNIFSFYTEPFFILWLVFSPFLPRIFSEGHPPAVIFIAPFFWLVLGVIFALIVRYKNRA